MKFLSDLFSDLSASFAAAMTAIITAVLCLMLFSLWNNWIDNPRVAEGARSEYVKISELEAANAKAKTAQDLLDLANAKNTELAEQLAGYDAANAQFSKSQQISANLKKEQDDDLAEVEAGRSAVVPSVGELGIFDRLRNR